MKTAQDKGKVEKGGDEINLRESKSEGSSSSSLNADSEDFQQLAQQVFGNHLVIKA